MSASAPSTSDVAQAAKHVELIVQLHDDEITPDQLARLAELRSSIRMLDAEDDEHSLVRVMRALEEQLVQRKRRSAPAASALRSAKDTVVTTPPDVTIVADAKSIPAVGAVTPSGVDELASSIQNSPGQSHLREAEIATVASNISSTTTARLCPNESRYLDPSLGAVAREARGRAEVGSATRGGGASHRVSALSPESRSSSASGATVEPEPALEWRGSWSTAGNEVDDGAGSSGARSPRPADRSHPRANSPTSSSHPRARDRTVPTTPIKVAFTVDASGGAREGTRPVPRELPLGKEVVLRPLWTPSVIALQADPPPPPTSSPDVPEKHRLCLLLRTVMHKPSGFKEKDEAMNHQGHYCKGCLCPLRPTFRAMRLGMSWDDAKFCYYTGYYYCKDCHPCSEMSVIPARVLNYWDFTPLSVCSDAKSFLELQFEVPLLCVSAINPKLYDVLPVLRMARSLRLQLNILREIGWTCPQFQREFFGQDIAQGDSSSSNNSDGGGGGNGESEVATTVDEMIQLSGRRVHRAQAEAVAHRIPYGKRYLVEDSEFWSLSDLCEIKDVGDYAQRSDLDEMKRNKELWAVDAQGKIMGTSSTFSRFRTTGSSDPSGPASPTTTSPASSATTGAGGGSNANATLRALMGGTPLNSYTLSADSSATSADTPLPPGEAYLTLFLKQTRSHMVRHVVQLCRQGPNCCFQRAARICPICKKKEFVYLFDLNRTRTCTRCHSCYHRECWQRRKGHHTACVVCMEKVSGGSSAAATDAERDP